MNCPSCKDVTLVMAERQTGDRPHGDYPDQVREPERHERHERHYRDDEYTSTGASRASPSCVICSTEGLT